MRRRINSLISIKMFDRRQSGFTLIEILIVVAIIAVVAAMAGGLFMKSRVAANEASAIGSMKQIMSAQNQYRLTRPVFGTRADLITAGLINDPELANGKKSGYLFDVLLPDTGQYRWYAEAVPDVYDSSGNRSFYLDENGVIHAKDTGGADMKTRDEAITWPTLE